MVSMADPDLAHSLKHFESIPWTQKFLTNPDYTLVPTPSRKPKQSTEDAMFAETLNTRDTVRAWLAFQKKPVSNDALITEARFFLSLGNAVSGWPHVVHGGMVSLIMDEAMGSLLQFNVHSGNKTFPPSTFTAYLNTKYVKPMPAPSVSMVVARLREIKGRKIFLDAVVEDKDGNEMATGKALFIAPKEPLAKL